MGTRASESYSQSGEDRLVLDYFGAGFRGTYLELGANDPEELSQTYLLEKQGWQGVLVEPNPTLAAALREKRSAQVFECAVSSPDNTGTAYLAVPSNGHVFAEIVFDEPSAGEFHPVEVRSVDEILGRAGVGSLDFVSIDIEGMELAALQGFSVRRYAPRLILLEDQFYSLRKHVYMRKLGYELVDRTGCNSWYVPEGAGLGRDRVTSRLETFRKMYLSLPFRKLRMFLKRFRG